MRKLILIISMFVFTLSSCRKERSNYKREQVIKPAEYHIKSEENKTNLDFFDKLPDTIEGCNYTIKFNNKYVLISNYECAIIKLNNKVHYLRKDTVESTQISETKFKEVFSGSGVKVIIDEDIYNQINETFKIKGIMKIRGNNINISKEIKGLGGC